jgi:hypothetical protein
LTLFSAASAAAAVFAAQARARLPRGGAADLLQLALNCSSTAAAGTAVGHLPATAAAAARRLPELLEPDVARRLLVTAATRQHTAAVENMVTLAYMQQPIDAGTLEAMLVGLLEHNACLSVLIRLPAAAQLSSEDVIRLLLTAAAREAVLSVCVLRRLPAAQQFDSAAVFQLLKAAIPQDHVPWPFCQPPAAAQLSSSDVFQLLQAAVQGSTSTSVVGYMCYLPGAQQMNCQAVLQLLQTAVQHERELTRIDAVSAN